MVFAASQRANRKPMPASLGCRGPIRLFGGFKIYLPRPFRRLVTRFCGAAKDDIVQGMSEPETRLLTADEHQLIKWMLEHGSQDALSLLPQLALARATSWRCPCGCASLNLVLEGKSSAEARPMQIVADFVFGPEDRLSGIFLFEKGGMLAGLEVYGLPDEAPKYLPACDVLRPL
jgi:hypothetical protein